MSDETVTTGETPAATNTQAVEEAKPAQAETWEDGSPFDASKAKELITKLRGELKEV